MNFSHFGLMKVVILSVSLHTHEFEHVNFNLEKALVNFISLFDFGIPKVFDLGISKLALQDNLLVR